MNMKKIIASILACTVIGSAVPVDFNMLSVDIIAFAEDTEYTEGTYENLTYRKYSNYIEITGCDISAETVVIPDEIDGLPVTVIGESAFADCNKITSLKLPEKLKLIETLAFSKCKSLEKISIPESVTEIQSFAFMSCEKLSDIHISDNLLKISGYAFMGTAWYKSKPEGKIVYIGKVAYKYKPYGDYYVQFVINAGTRAVAQSAFANCYDADEIKLPESVEYIGEEAFLLCTPLKKLTILNPHCEIYDSDSTISTRLYYSDKNYYYEGVICGYDGSTAQEYAEKYGYRFESLGKPPVNDTGDINCDGSNNIADLVLLSSHILAESKLTAEQCQKADLNNDGIIDVFDMIELRKLVVQ